MFTSQGKNMLEDKDFATQTGINNIAGMIDQGQFNFGGQDKAAVAIKQYQKIYGRPPSPQELTYALTANGGDINSYIANKKLAEDNTPDKLAAKQQADYLAQAPQHYDDVKQAIQGQLGRAATQDELDHFGSMLASGSTDKYQLQQFLQQQPEYQQTQNKNFQNGLSDQLSGYDKQYFQDSILPGIQEAYAKQGRSFDSSAFQNAATNSAQQQNTQRQSFLANLSAQQYGNTQANAYNDYARQVANQQNLTNQGIQAQYGNVQNQIGRANNYTDFQMQQDAYNQYLAKYGKRNNGMGSLIGGGIGAAAGAYFGGPAGASVGYGIGSGLGQAGQNYFGGGSY